MLNSFDKVPIKSGASEVLAKSERARAQARRVRLRAQRVRKQVRGSRAPLPRLSPREREVLALLSVGLTSKDIAAQLAITRNTTVYHLANIYRKLGVHSRVEAANAYFSRVVVTGR